MGLSAKAMAPHSCTLAWKIPWMEEPGRLQSMGSLRVGHSEWLHFHFSLSCIGEGMATHSSVLAWRIPGTGEPGGLPSMGSHRVRHDWSDLAAAWDYNCHHLFSFPRLPQWLSGKESICQCRRLQRLWVQSPGGEDPLEEEMVTCSNILAWRIPREKKPGRLHTVHRITKSQTRLSSWAHTSHSQR